MSVTIKIFGDAGCNPTEHDGRYLKTFVPDVDEWGRGDLTTTPERREAMQFSCFQAAFEFWRQTSTVRPLRPDGKPNRPLTAYNVEIR